MGRMVKAPTTLFSHDDDIFNSNSKFSGDVDPWLVAESHIFPEIRCVALDQVRRFVSIQTNAMSQSVGEIFPVARFFDDGARSTIHAFAGCAGTICIESGLMCCFDDGIDVEEFLGGRTNVNGPRNVRMIALIGSSKVHHHGITSLDESFAGLMVG